MAALIESGRIAGLILVVLVLEGVVLSALVLFRRQRLPLAGLLLNLAAGACLLLGLRAVFTGADWKLAGAWLGAAGLAHAADVILRLRD